MGTSRDSDGGTQEYPPVTDEYRSDTGDSVHSETPEAAREALRRQPPWWEREGFSSLADALAEAAAARDRVMGRKPRDLRGLSLEQVIFSEPERPPEIRDRRRRRDRQVNVKLTSEEHASLEEAARRYGVATATLARIFVVRAAKLALDQ